MSLDQSLLFLKLPAPEKSAESGDYSIRQLFDGLSSNVPYSELIDTCYFLLKSGTLLHIESLRIWEIRLTLILFNGDLSIAKKEGINLNNKLYLLENKDREAPPPAGAASSSISRTLLLASSAPDGTLPIYPLPRNNDSQIGHSLLILLLRLKSIPNMNLVNELYKLTYQRRLKTSGQPEVTHQLANLSYDIIAVLMITKNYHTLVNFILSILYEEPESEYSSRLVLILLIVKLILHAKKQAGSASGSTDKVGSEALVVQYEQDFRAVSQPTLASFQYILNNFNPNISPGITSARVEDITLEVLVERVQMGLVSGRIVCCTLGLWNLQNTIGIEVSDGELVLADARVEEGSGAGDTDKDSITEEECYKEVVKDWIRNINRVYCLE